MMNNTINEIKNYLEGSNNRVTEAEEWIIDLEDKIVEITTTEQNKEKRMKRIQDSLRDLWDNIKHTNILIIGLPEEEEKKRETENDVCCGLVIYGLYYVEAASLYAYFLDNFYHKWLLNFVENFFCIY